MHDIYVIEIGGVVRSRTGNLARGSVLLLTVCELSWASGRVVFNSFNHNRTRLIFYDYDSLWHRIFPTVVK